MPEKFSDPYIRKVTPIERFLRHSPYSIVTMVVRIRGNVTESQLRNAVLKIRQRHVNLRVRITEDQDRVPWFTSEGAGEIPVDVVPRKSGTHWIQVLPEASRIPFDFDARPAVRFILVQSSGLSELIILCHHILCDGLSLAYLARDLMIHLGDPSREVEALPDPVLMDLDTMPAAVSINPVVRHFLNRINRQWEKEKVSFTQEDYESIHKAYWEKYPHQMLSIELTEDQTSALVERCRREGVTVNSALTAAFLGAEARVQGRQPHHASVYVAANVRDRLRMPAGEVMGFYAGMVSLKHAYADRLDFPENARRFQKKVRPLLTDKKLFQDFLAWCHLDPAMLEAIHFKKLGGIVAPDQPGYQKLSAFAQRGDTVLSILRRDKQDSLDRKFMGTAVTNLTRMDFPRAYGPLELDRLILQPGGGFPLSTVNLVLGAVTCAGKLSLVVEYAERAVDTATVKNIRDDALGVLLNA
ncbi:MAG: hypothetical protein JW748_07745 [Anaerolineales bacterium]|nr:hypothetical protein [Anaerolineales bacterium]